MYRFLLVMIFVSAVSAKYITGQETNGLISPFSFEASYIGDYFSNNSGGIKQGTRYLGMASLKISFDTKRAGLWEGGQFFINACNTHGGTPTHDLFGDYQGASNIEAGGLTSLQELWFRQSFNNVIIYAGLQDIASDFAVSENGALFINSSLGTPSIMSSNIPCPTFPFTALSVQVQVNFNESLLIKTALFDGQPDNLDGDDYNISWKLNRNEGLLSITELNYLTGFAGLPGTYKFGAYYHSRTPVISEQEVEEYTNNYGVYFIADQTLLEQTDTKRLSMFLQAGASPYSKNDNYLYFGAGINYTGIFADDDVVGAALADALLHNRYYSNETAVELSYMAMLTENIFLQPDLQYIIHPSGTGERLSNALLGGVRFGVQF